MFQTITITLLKGLSRTIRIIFWSGLWLFGVGILVSYLMRWWSGDRLLPVRLVNYLMPWLLTGLVPGLIMAGLARRYRLVAVLAIPTLIIGLSYAPLFLPRSSIALADGSSFKVMSYNVWRKNSNIEAIAKLIREEQPDVLLLQELRPARVQPLVNALEDLYPGAELNLAYESESRQAIISHYPLSRVTIMPEKGRALKGQLETPGGPITVINVHLIFPGWQRRYNQMSHLLVEDILPADNPIILGGDFNTTDQTQTYQLINQHLRNAHWEAGWSFGFSFPSPELRFRYKISYPSLVRIDHIFYSDHFFAHRAGTLTESGGSDHLPVVTELSWIKAVPEK
jgi:endonuclease/exonuclease/phosphatase (EEP) superfamily protein YafD